MERDGEREGQAVVEKIMLEGGGTLSCGRTAPGCTPRRAARTTARGSIRCGCGAAERDGCCWERWCRRGESWC